MDTDVIVAGAGPVGLMLAGELALAGTRVIVVEKLAVRSGQSKSMNLQPRTAEVLDLRGLLSRTDEDAIGRVDRGHFAGIPLRYDGLDTRFPYQVGILQARVEAVLERRLAELGGELRREWALTGFESDAEGVTVHGPEKSGGLATSDGPETSGGAGTSRGAETLRARYLVGCDGGRSTVRKLLGVGFPGTEPTHYTTLADVVLDAGTAALPTGWVPLGNTRRRRADGSFASVVPIGEPGLYRLVYFDGQRERTEVAPEEVAAALRTFYGEEYTLREVRYASRFSDASRQAETYRVGRVLLAGDAAHTHPPTGGQGLNLGVQDAINLGWKLAAVVAGRMPESLLDTYQAERVSGRRGRAGQHPRAGCAAHAGRRTPGAVPDRHRTAGRAGGQPGSRGAAQRARHRLRRSRPRRHPPAGLPDRRGLGQRVVPFRTRCAAGDRREAPGSGQTVGRSGHRDTGRGVAVAGGGRGAGAAGRVCRLDRAR